MPADPAILQRIRGCPFARGGRVLVPEFAVERHIWAAAALISC